MYLTLTHTADQSRLTCRGEIDVATAPILKHALDLVMATRPPVLLVDWRSVPFVSVEGIDVLNQAASECRANGGVLQLIPGDAARRVLDILGWNDIEESDPYALPTEVEEALVSALSMN